MSATAPLHISTEDRKEINAFARKVKTLPIFSHCQVAIRCLDDAEHTNLAHFGIREPGGVGATDLADFGPRLADLRVVNDGHPSGVTVLDFYTYGRYRVGGDLELDTNVQAVFQGDVLVALSCGSSDILWLVEPDPEPVLISRRGHLGASYDLLRIGTQYRVRIDWPDGRESQIGDWSSRLVAASEARAWIEDNLASFTPALPVLEPCGACGDPQCADWEPAAEPTSFHRIHVEHDPSQQQVVKLCADHLRLAESCGMVDQHDVPAVDSTCFCLTCHFCDAR